METVIFAAKRKLLLPSTVLSCCLKGQTSCYESNSWCHLTWESEIFAAKGKNHLSRVRMISFSDSRGLTDKPRLSNKDVILLATSAGSGS